jgi:hypothetical protein
MIALALHLAYLKPKDLPSACKPDLSTITDRVCLQKMESTDLSLKDRLIAIEDREINAMIEAILRMYDAVTRYQPLLELQDRERKVRA